MCGSYNGRVYWNGDGLFDIVSGTKKGGAYVWLNVGERGKPAFSAPTQLLAEVDPGAGIVSDSPGERTQVHVADYHGDGSMDLLVGDYRRVDGKAHGWAWLVRRDSKDTDASKQ